MTLSSTLCTLGPFLAESMLDFFEAQVSAGGPRPGAAALPVAPRAGDATAAAPPERPAAPGRRGAAGLHALVRGCGSRWAAKRGWGRESCEMIDMHL